MKRSRIEAQFRRFESVCLNGLRAGIWFNWKLVTHAPGPWFEQFDRSIRQLASRRASARKTEVSNEIRDIWSKRKPVAHLALSAANAIGRLHQTNNWAGFGLAGTLLAPTWVSEAINQSEEWFRSGSTVMEPSQFYHFRRDTF
jgi:hypothetical protein